MGAAECQLADVDVPLCTVSGVTFLFQDIYVHINRSMPLLFMDLLNYNIKKNCACLYEYVQTKPTRIYY